MLEFAPRLAEAGIGPRLLHVEEIGVCFERCDRHLADWWPGATADQLGDMGREIARLIRTMHRAGLCHRDIHHLNVMLRSGTPLVIDPEWAIDVDPELMCYDLFGPGDVPLLEAHRAYGGVLGEYGIWWDAPVDERFVAQCRPMGSIFGPLADFPAEA